MYSLSYTLWNGFHISIVQHFLTEKLSLIIVTLFLLNYCHEFIVITFWNGFHISIVQHILTEQLVYIVVTQTLKNSRHVLNDIYIMELLPYINRLTYPYRAVGIYCCQTNLKKLLLCIKWHIPFSIADIYKLFNIP